ncbi:MAG: hypothetical protein K2O92_05910, partial [Lachnospiraceae bacterium]|nr:hypothetical protein [Lachnospiraceae bacterium]
MEWYPCSYSGGIADKSLGIVNCFSQRPESLNIDFREPGFADKITYMTATDASIEGAPPTNAVIINLGYGNTHWGVQLGFNPSSVVSARRAYMRSSLGDGTYSEWVDFITGNNLDNQLDTHGVTYLAQTFGNNRGLPFAGTTGDIPAEGFSEWFKTVRSGFYTMVNGTGGWMQAVVLKHRNGHGDGTGYGIYIYDSFTSKTRTLKWNKMVNNEMFGNDLTILDTGNYSSQIGRINNRLLLDHGSYVNTQSGTNGTAGLVNFMRIKITSTYADYPLIFLLSGRGRNMPMLVSVHYQSYNGLYPDISSFYRMFNDTYDIYIHNTGGGVWNLYAPKNEAYGAVDILGLWYSSGHFEITFPNTHVASVNSAWTKAITAGITNAANFLKDSGNAVPVYLSYNKSSISVSNTTWLAGWVNNGSNYELRAFNRADLIQAKMANGYYGMCFGNYQDNGWVRTTQQGLLPYQSGNISSPHSQLGTETWWFLKSYIA